MIDAILSAIDAVTGSDDIHTFTVSAPLCIPIRELWTALHRVGIRGDFVVLPSLSTHQTARMTVSRKQVKYASLLLWKQAAVWESGLNIKNDPWRRKSQNAVMRNGYAMPKPWRDNGKPWKQKGCKK